MSPHEVLIRATCEHLALMGAAADDAVNNFHSVADAALRKLAESLPPHLRAGFTAYLDTFRKGP